jgi:hypothetical protein
MEKFYPRIAQFARGEGYPCGNKGVFIPRRNKCWTHPKTGNKLKQPLTYQKYQEAKEKSQKSRTEKGRTALQDREQGFRDKAREKAKGWQNKTPETKPTLANEDKMRDTLKKAIAENELNKSLAETAYQKYHQYQNGLKNEAEGLSSRSIANLYQIPHATAVARINGLREAVGLGGSNAVSVDKELGGRINDLLNNGKQIKINSSGGQLKDQKKEPSQTTINADKKWSDFLDSKNVTEKGLRKLDPETRKKITEEFENTRIEERVQESSKRKGLSLPEDPKPSPNSTGVEEPGDRGKKEFELLNSDKLSSAKQLVNLRKNTELASKKPNQTQKEYDRNQPDLNIDSGLGMTEGWRTADENGSVRGIPWTVKMENKETPSVLTGARLTNHPGSNRIRRLELHTSDNMVFPVEFKKGDRDASLRARRLVKEIAQGKSQEMDAGDIKALIEGGKDGLAKRKVENARLATEEKQFNVALDSYLKSKNLTRESFRGMSNEAMDDVIEKVENIAKQQKTQLDPKPSPNSTGVKGAGGKTLDLKDLWQQTADAAYSKNKDGVSKNLEQWKEVVKKLESGEGISKDVNLNEYEKLMDNLERKLVLNPKDPSNVEFKKITGSIYRTLDKAVRYDPLTQEDLEKAHPNFRPIMQRMKKTVTKVNELSGKKQQSQKELDTLKHRQSYNELIVKSNSRQFREMGIDNNYNELRLLTARNPNEMVEVRNPVSNLPERTVTLPERLNEINRDIRDLSDDKKAQISQDRAKEEIARLQKPIKGMESQVNSLADEIKRLRESRGEPNPTTKRRTKKKDFNSNLKLAQFAKPGCCCDASKPLRRRKTKQTPRLKRRGTRYA